MNFEPIEKLRIWQQFDGDMRSLPPILVIVAALVTILAPIPGVAGAVKNNQMIIALVSQPFCVSNQRTESVLPRVVGQYIFLCMCMWLHFTQLLVLLYLALIYRLSVFKLVMLN